MSAWGHATQRSLFVQALLWFLNVRRLHQEDHLGRGQKLRSRRVLSRRRGEDAHAGDGLPRLGAGVLDDEESGRSYEGRGRPPRGHRAMGTPLERAGAPNAGIGDSADCDRAVRGALAAARVGGGGRGARAAGRSRLRSPRQPARARRPDAGLEPYHAAAERRWAARQSAGKPADRQEGGVGSASLQ